MDRTNYNDDDAQSSAVVIQNDLDLFLAGIETKLRGPFSSLDLAKYMNSISSLQRDKLTQHQYLHRLSLVIHKTDKITQLRILLAMLGLKNPTTANNDADSATNEDGTKSSTDQDIWDVLQVTQESSNLYEDWVRICSGLIQGILFETEQGLPLIGEEAKKILDKTTSQLIQKVQTIERQTEYDEDDTSKVPSRLDKADANPIMTPYRYALLTPTLLNMAIPETQVNAHFTVNENAPILHLDAAMEKTKLEEEMDHTTAKGSANSGSGAAAAAAAAAAASSSSATNGSAKSPPPVFLPGRGNR